MKKLPARLYICPCGYQSEYRWVLANHIQQVHHEGKREAQRLARECEYFANPLYYRVSDIEEEEDEED